MSIQSNDPVLDYRLKEIAENKKFIKKAMAYMYANIENEFIVWKCTGLIYGRYNNNERLEKLLAENEEREKISDVMRKIDSTII
jgi:hypothetical protein